MGAERLVRSQEPGEEIAMVLNVKSIGTLVLRLM
jgi:hypothetical protein